MGKDGNARGVVGGHHAQPFATRTYSATLWSLSRVRSPLVERSGCGATGQRRFRGDVLGLGAGRVAHVVAKLARPSKQDNWTESRSATLAYKTIRIESKNPGASRRPRP